MNDSYQGLGHQDHPLLNQLVHDAWHDVTGRLMAVCPELPPASGPFNPAPRNGPAVAWLRPAEGGGREWTAPLGSITRAGNPTAERPG